MLKNVSGPQKEWKHSDEILQLLREQEKNSEAKKVDEVIKWFKEKYKWNLNNISEVPKYVMRLQDKIDELENHVKQRGLKFTSSLKEMESSYFGNGQHNPSIDTNSVTAREELIKENKRLQGETNRLSVENEQLANQMVKLEEIIRKTKEDNYEKEKAATEKRNISSKEKDNIQLHVENLEEDLKSITNCLGKSACMEQLQNEIRELSTRLSQEMSNKIGKNESALENVSIQCRPMNIADEYEQLCSGVWMDAKNDLQKGIMDEATSAKWLCGILLTSEKEAKNVFKEILAYVHLVLQQPLNAIKMIPKREPKETTLTWKTNFENDISDFFRRNVEDIDLNFLFERTTAEVMKEQISDSKGNKIDTESLLQMEEIKAYTKKVCSLAWKMSIQRPQMSFSTKGEGQPNDEKKHDVAWDSAPGHGAVIQYYWHPELLHGDKTMVKGRVFVNAPLN